uniref:RBR-type E3 ubiquitin transferase n=1 Tax=Cercocebus atys TaxID=9531 RepID=A0A2K5LTD7_CERAT
MSVDMNSQASDSNEEHYDSNCEEVEEEEDADPGDIEDYHLGVATNVEQQGADAFDPEEYQFTYLTYRKSEGALNEHMTSLDSVLKVSHSVAKLILILDRYKSNSAQLLIECVCSLHKRKTYSPWSVSTSFAAAAGSSTAQTVPLHTPEDFVFPLLYLFRGYVESHYQLQLCPGADCLMVIRCNRCNEVFCFKCHQICHAPTDCVTIPKWLMNAHIKDCPKCNICIEKNGGCNHMQRSKCIHHFCWMNPEDWKCSTYKENSDIVNQCQQAQEREALKKYLFYLERWENHNKSLRLEAQTYQRIHEKIHERVMNHLGTWIDWQYLQNAAKLLAKCQYILQYTNPHAYYMESGPRKKLFEYQQAQLEAEMENLSWKVKHADSCDRGDLDKQMHIAEQVGRTLLKDFHDT